MSDSTQTAPQKTMPAKLAAAFVKAQASFTGAIKDSTNPAFKSKYADMESVVSAIRAPLAANGLSFTQFTHERPDYAAVETLIVHESGEMYSCGIMCVPVVKKDAQGFGSAMTYARRYSLQTAFGIAPEDDDGNMAVKSGPISSTLPSTAQPAAAKPAAVQASAPASANDGEVASPTNVTAIRKALMNAGRDETSMLAWLKSPAKSLDMITPAEAERAAKSLNIALPESTEAPMAAPAKSAVASF